MYVCMYVYTYFDLRLLRKWWRSPLCISSSTIIFYTHTHTYAHTWISKIVWVILQVFHGWQLHEVRLRWGVWTGPWWLPPGETWQCWPSLSESSLPPPPACLPLSIDLCWQCQIPQYQDGKPPWSETGLVFVTQNHSKDKWKVRYTVLP